ncbi:MAG: sel1 repeat family protein [Proteobacteria bacterium]|nr:sel1 repeat family protein [Pseudomonadota bacterium]
MVNVADEDMDCLGDITLEADGQGQHMASGYFDPSDAIDDNDGNDESEGAINNWNGYTIPKSGKWSALGLIEKLLPQKWEVDEEALRSDFKEERSCFEFAQRLAGLDVSRFCNSGHTWSLLYDALRNGEPLPFDNAVTLTFEWPAQDRAYPKENPTQAGIPITGTYADDIEMHIGDEVKLPSGETGTITNLTGFINAGRIEVCTAFVETAAGLRVIPPQRINRIRFLRRSKTPRARPDVKTLEKQAEQGNANAQCQLGYLFHNSDYIAQNPIRSAHWLKQAAGQGNPDAQYRLAKHYREEFGVLYDHDQVLAWLEKAVEGGHIEAVNELIGLYEWKKDASIPFVLLAAENGNEYAQFELAQRCLNGDGLEKDLAKAALLFEAAAKQGLSWAQVKIGECFEREIGVPRNDEHAAYWYGQAAAQKYQSGMLKLASFYLHRLDMVPSSSHRTILEKAAKAGIKDAQSVMDRLD